MFQKKNVRFMMLAVLISVLSLLSFYPQSGQLFAIDQTSDDGTIGFLYTSDAHYGIEKDTFRGQNHVSAHEVNAAMIEKMNQMPQLRFPQDNSVGAGQLIGDIDFVAQTGDVANRQETKQGYQIMRASDSWNQFEQDYLEGITVKNKWGMKAPLYLSPGNHDATNAIGSFRKMFPLTDSTAMLQMYNLMMKPLVPLNEQTYDYRRDKVNYSIDVDGVHMIFVQLWPDSTARQWMENDLQHVSSQTPVMIFTHVPPECGARMFINPNPPYDLNKKYKFESLLDDRFVDGTTVDEVPMKEQEDFAHFLQEHKNIVAYFHGHTNYNQYYTWQGTTNCQVNLNAFRVDSPMKGEISADDESKLSYQMVVIDVKMRKMTVRECLWNQGSEVVWGSSSTVDVVPGG